jgi:two-component system response regulator LytT
MKSLEEKLPPETFIRIQRSYIIAPDKIDAVSKSSVCIGNTEIMIGAQYKSGFQEVVNERL